MLRLLQRRVRLCGTAMLLKEPDPTVMSAVHCLNALGRLAGHTHTAKLARHVCGLRPIPLEHRPGWGLMAAALC